MIRPPSNGRDTSDAAAESMSLEASSLRDRVQDLIRASGEGGLTTDEIEQLLDLNHQTASPRVWELHKRCLIGDSGKRRKTRSGRLAIVYRTMTIEEINRRLAGEAAPKVQLSLPFGVPAK